MNVLVIGSGGREHALVWKLQQSPRVAKLFCAPGNPGMSAQAQCVPLKSSDYDALAAFALRESIDLTIVGPEAPLADGIADLFRSRGLTVFGPTKAAAALEWSKAFAKDFMFRNGIPTAGSKTFDAGQISAARAFLDRSALPVVLKADGLAAGKGVLICATREEAHDGLTGMLEANAFGAAGTTVVIEEYMEGIEASVFAVSDGERFVTLAPAQDHKRVFDDDRGKNTGGMGAYAPTQYVSTEVMDVVRSSIVAPALRGMAREGKPYTGCLYVGLMLTNAGPKVVEFNSRFGDPETQVVLPLYDGDLAALLSAAARGSLGDVAGGGAGSARSANAVCVVLASAGYPDKYPVGLEIQGLDLAGAMPGVSVFHAGTAWTDGRIVTSGGRVLGVTATVRGQSLASAIDLAYAAAGTIAFDGMQFRRDIGRKGLAY